MSFMSLYYMLSQCFSSNSFVVSDFLMQIFPLNVVAVCQANGQTMSRMQMFALYFKTELAPPNPIEAKESIAKFLDLPFKMSAQKIANMNVKVRESFVIILFLIRPTMKPVSHYSLFQLTVFVTFFYYLYLICKRCDC